MSYVPLAKEQSDSSARQSAKHKNPLYPTLKYPQPKPLHTLQSQITASLLFQQLIYFNWYYSFIECYLFAGSQIYRFMYFSMEYGVPVRTIVGVIFLALEYFRLKNGLEGNIKESFPQICAFLLITFLTIGCQIILLSPMTPPSPMEFSVVLYGVILHILQFLVCICTMGKLTQGQNALSLWRKPSAKLR